MTTRSIFEGHHQVPEKVPSALLIPADRPDLWAPHELQHTADTTTPREVGYVFYEGILECFSVERSILDLKETIGTTTTELFAGGWGNHVGRTVLRVMLDPNRTAAINMVRAYENELTLARFADPDEKYFFEHFLENFGVVSREVKTAQPI